MTPDELDAIEARAEACPFCTREAQAECESTGGRCSEIDAVLDDRPDLDAHEALIAGLREARAEVERLRDKSRVRVEHQRGTTFGVYIDGEYVGTIDGEA